MTQTKRVVVVTGGSSGIGKAIAKAFSADSQVVIMARNEAALRSAANELGSNVSWQRADVGRRDDIAAATAAIIEQFGVIDVLINGAGFVEGITTSMPLDEAEQVWDRVLDGNLKGSFLMAMAVAPYLPRPGGRIINISSIAAYTGGSRPGSVAYAAAKAGVHGMTYGLARELSPLGITVNAIAPGFIADTGFTGGWPQARAQSIVAETPVGRPGHADDIAAAACYLASPEASFVTGAVLNVNGGWRFGH